MSDVSPEATSEIEVLLADRQRLQAWLDRLESTADRTPAGIRQRVQADYEGRLAEVVARLRGFSTALTASLSTLRSQRSDLLGERTEVDEARAEAELRHAVGEYSDGDWERLDAEANKRIAAFTHEVDRLSAEIGRLEEVLSLITPAPERPQPAPEPPQPVLQAPAPPAPPAPRAVRPRPADERSDIQPLEREEIMLTARGPETTDDTANTVRLDPEHMDDIEAIRPGTPRPTPIEAPRFTPKLGSEPKPPTRTPTAPRTLRFPTPPPADGTSTPPPSVDEMTFLKSVTLDSPASRERSAAENRPTAAAKARGANANKTLKCAECGSMNRPTEWYCERCGAELAAL